MDTIGIALIRTLILAIHVLVSRVLFKYIRLAVHCHYLATLNIYNLRLLAHFCASFYKDVSILYTSTLSLLEFNVRSGGLCLDLLVWLFKVFIQVL